MRIQNYFDVVHDLVISDQQFINKQSCYGGLYNNIVHAKKMFHNLAKLSWSIVKWL